MARRRHRTTVRLTGIRLREQGTHDSFCAYYAAAMLLCTLRPEMDDDFDAVDVKHDPLFSHLPRAPRRTLERTVADWLTTGVRFGPLARSLNETSKPRLRKTKHKPRGDVGDHPKTRFRARRLTFGARTLDLLRSNVDEGLPCVLGWESQELGNHTVLVVGYDRYARRGGHRWLRVLDPTRGQDIIEWGQLARVATAPADVIWCVAHDGVRPDRVTVDRDAEGNVLRSRFERYSPKERAWESLIGPPRPTRTKR
jgi:hypothetical protein